MEIKILNSETEIWDNYVKDNGFEFTMLSGWKDIIEKHYGCKAYWYYADDNGQIVGILPLFFMKSFLFGKVFTCNPISGIGIAADNDKVIVALAEYAKNLVDKHDADWVELRLGKTYNLNGFELNKEHFQMILELDNNPELIWQHQMQKEVRNQVRKAQNFGLDFDLGNKYLHDFFLVYAKNMRNIGGIHCSFSFFQDVIDRFPENFELDVIKSRGEVIGGVILLKFGDYVINLWGSADKHYIKMCPNNILYWKTIERCCEQGYKFFNLGRSQEGSGTYNFKAQWGAKPKQLFYYYYLKPGKKMPSAKGSKGKLSILINIWKHLPLFVTKSIAPLLQKHVPL